MTERDHVEDIVVVPEQSAHLLNQRQLVDYRDHREKLIKWLLYLGKDPEKAEGYAHDTVRQRVYKLDTFYRWVWEQQDGYTLTVTPEHADEYSKELAYEDSAGDHDSSTSHIGF